MIESSFVFSDESIVMEGEKVLRSVPFASISVVVPVFKNAETLPLLVKKLKKELMSLQLSFELLFVVDACPEDSLNVLRKLAIKDFYIKIVALNRNLGQHWATLIGLAHASGNVIITMDADLQDSPGSIPDLLNKLDKNISAVFAGRRGRYESRIRLLTSRILKNLLSRLSGGRIPPDAGLFIVMKKEMVEGIMKLYIKNPHIISLMGKTGLPMISIAVERAASFNNKSGYTFIKRLCLGWRALSGLLRPELSYIFKKRTIATSIKSDFISLLTKYNF